MSNVSNKLTETGPFSAASFNANREESAEKQKQASKVDLSVTKFNPIEKFFEDKPMPYFDDPAYYKTCLTGEGQPAQRVHQVLFCNGLNVIQSDSIFALIDVANGHMSKILDVSRRAKNLYGDKITIMAGNIANPQTYIQYAEAGIDYCRCGIGGGNCCITATQLGIFCPMATLISDIYNIKKFLLSQGKKNLPKIVADGGVRNYDDIIKALAYMGEKNIAIRNGILSIFTKKERVSAPAWDAKQGFKMHDYLYTSSVVNSGACLEQFANALCTL